MSHIYLLVFHLLGAAIWTGGHLVLATRVLPKALAERSAERVLAFERAFEPVGLVALAVQVVTGILLALDFGDVSTWFSAVDGIQRAVLLKLGLLLVTVLLALHARLRLIPRLTDDRLGPLAWHIVSITVVGVAMMVGGVLFRIGGL